MGRKLSAENYRLRVTGGPSYDKSTHVPVAVNTSTPLVITTPNATTVLHLRLQSLRAPTATPLPTTHPYFTHPAHISDLYSFQLSFTPNSATPIPGDALVFGNDFSHPVRKSLPMGFNIVWKFAKWVDPGMQGDLYAEQPWIYGSVLSSMNVIRVKGPNRPAPSEPRTAESNDLVRKTKIDVEDGDSVMEEDMTAIASTALPIPSTAARRKKFFLDDTKRQEVEFRKGYTYGFDFFGPWLDFDSFQVKLPGFTVNLLRYWDGQPVRFVLKNLLSGEVYAVIVLDFVEVGSDEERGVGPLSS